MALACSALALAVGFGTFQLSASILPSNVPNLIMTSAAETTLGIHFAYLPYLFLHAPVLGILKAIALTACLVLLFAQPVSRLLRKRRIGTPSSDKR